MIETTMQTDDTVVQRSEEHGGIKHATTPTLMENIDGKMNHNQDSQGILFIIHIQFSFSFFGSIRINYFHEEILNLYVLLD